METDAGAHPLERPLWMGTTLICRYVREGTRRVRAPEDTTSPAIFSRREKRPHNSIFRSGYAQFLSRVTGQSRHATISRPSANHRRRGHRLLGDAPEAFAGTEQIMKINSIDARLAGATPPHRLEPKGQWLFAAVYDVPAVTDYWYPHPQHIQRPFALFQ
jgi:hypothetical protein